MSNHDTAIVAIVALVVIFILAWAFLNAGMNGEDALSFFRARTRVPSKRRF